MIRLWILCILLINGFCHQVTAENTSPQPTQGGTVATTEVATGTAGAKETTGEGATTKPTVEASATTEKQTTESQSVSNTPEINATEVLTTKAQTTAPDPTIQPTINDPCSPNPCKNNRNCTGNGTCECGELFSGSKCEKEKLVAAITFKGNYNDTIRDLNKTALNDLKDTFAEAIAKSLSIDKTLVEVTKLRPGSVIADTIIHTEKSQDTLKNLQTQVKQGTITVENFPVDTTAPVVSNAGAIFCDKNPCKNNGECDEVNSKCKCTDKYTGDTCETKNLCTNSYCVNGGTCKMEGTEAKCSCAAAYTGDYCEIPKGIVESLNEVDAKVETIKWEVLAMIIIVSIALILIIVLFIFIKKKPGGDFGSKSSFSPIAY